MLHEHPIKILRYTAKNLWLLIFPLLRSAHFFPFSAKEVAAWLHGAWFDLLICVLILTYGAIRWYFCGFMYNTEVIRRQSGILLKRETSSIFHLHRFHCRRLLFLQIHILFLHYPLYLAFYLFLLLVLSCLLIHLLSVKLYFRLYLWLLL